MTDTLRIRITAEAPPPETPCHCGSCEWRGQFKDVGSDHELTVPPNAALPAGLCPVCSDHAFVSDTDVWPLQSAPSTVAELLVRAYETGAANDGSIDWEDLDEAYAKAIEELPPARVAEIRAELGLTPTGEMPDDEEKDAVPIEVKDAWLHTRGFRWVETADQKWHIYELGDDADCFYVTADTEQEVIEEAYNHFYDGEDDDAS